MFQLFRGFSLAFSGFSFINHKSLRWFTLLPLLINFLVFVTFIATAYKYYPELQNLIAAFTPDFLDWLVPVLLWLLIPIGLVIAFILASITANLLAAPFNSLLAEKLETVLMGYPPPSNGKMLKQISMFIYIVLNELRKLLYIFTITGILIILSFVPLVNLIAPFLWIIGGAWLLAVEYLDYPMGNHNIQLTQQLQILKQHRFLSLGFGLGVMLITMIPVLNLLIMPVATCSATRLWISELHHLAKN